MIGKRGLGQSSNIFGQTIQGPGLQPGWIIGSDGQPVNNALNTLKYMPKKGAKIVYKVLWSAIANAQENAGLDVDDLKVARIHIDAAPQLKRFAARAKGRGTRIIKRNSHITVAVSDGKKD